MMGLLGGAMVRADDDDVIGPLRESIAAAPVIVEGEAERAYASWDGADPATVRTYTPFRLIRVLKGAQPAARILLRQPGGEVAGASAPARGAEFSEGEQAIVFLGAQDRADGSYDVFGGRKGKFIVQHDDSGRPVLEVRLGADASAYGRAEKAPGTGLARVPVELFEQLAAGATLESVADFDAQARAGNSSRASEPSPLPRLLGDLETRSGRSQLHVLLAGAVLVALGIAGWLMRRRTR